MDHRTAGSQRGEANQQKKNIATQNRLISDRQGELMMQKTLSIQPSAPRWCWRSCALVALGLFSLSLALPAPAAQQNCPALPGGTAPVNPPAGGFGIDGDLFANTPANIGD